MRLTIRLNLLFFILMIACLAAVLAISPILPVEYGIIELYSFTEGQVSPVLIDLDSGIQVVGTGTDLGNSPLFARTTSNTFPQVQNLDDNRFRLILSYPSEDREIGIYEGVGISIFGAFWYERDKTLMLVYQNREENASHLALVDVATGVLSPLAVYENFLAAHVSRSPNGAYLLLREAQSEEYRSVINPRPTLLVNLETYQAENIGLAVYAYWSPDGTALALGYETDLRFHITVERYDLESREKTIYPVTTSQQDVPYFNQNLSEVYGVVWSPDSQSLAVANRHLERISIVHRDGTMVYFEGGRIFPRHWSPTSQTLLGIGYDGDGTIGAFLINPQTGEANFLRSERVIQEQLSTFAWSPSGEYLAVLGRESGVNPRQSLWLYNLEGVQVMPVRRFSPTENGLVVLDEMITWTLKGY